MRNTSPMPVAVHETREAALSEAREWVAAKVTHSMVLVRKRYGWVLWDFHPALRAGVANDSSSELLQSFELGL